MKFPVFRYALMIWVTTIVIGTVLYVFADHSAFINRVTNNWTFILPSILFGLILGFPFLWILYFSICLIDIRSITYKRFIYSFLCVMYIEIPFWGLYYSNHFQPIYDNRI